MKDSVQDTAATEANKIVTYFHFRFRSFLHLRRIIENGLSLLFEAPRGKNGECPFLLY